MMEDNDLLPIDESERIRIGIVRQLNVIGSRNILSYGV